MFSRFHKQHIKRHNRASGRCLALLTLAALPLSLSCARLPPSVNGYSGRRIRVTMTFKGEMQTNLFYYFLINKYGPTGIQSTNGPVPVFGPLPGQNGSFGNGYATGSSTSTNGSVSGLRDYGITDFVLFHAPQRQNIGLYHYTQDPNRQPDPGNAILPLNVILPTTTSETDPQAARTLQFDIYMAQLDRDTTNITAQNQAGQNIEWINVNIVATNATPTDVTSNILKEVDAMGDTLSAGNNANNGNQSFLTVHLTENRTYRSSDVTSTLEEREDDVYPVGSSEPSLDLVSWSIQVIPN